MDKLHFLSDLRWEYREFLELPEYTAIPLGNDQGLLLSIWLGQGTRFLPGLTSYLRHAIQAGTLEVGRPAGMSGKKLGWRRAGADSGERWLRFEEEVFKFEPVAYRRCEDQYNKKDG
jgi:hypothetical protein